MPPLAVLFDFDGVLADTENIHVASWERTFDAMGWDVSPETCARAAEEDDRKFLQSIFATRSLTDGDLEGWLARKQELALRMMEDRPLIYPGVEDLIRSLVGRCKLAIVTGTSRQNVLIVLKGAGLESAFPVIVSKEDVSHSKPHPEPYQLALEKLGVHASEAVALEDSPSGLGSARGAGVRAIAIGHRRPPGEWTGDAFYLESLENLDQVLSAIGQSSGFA